jgi:hypothetical protein
MLSFLRVIKFYFTILLRFGVQILAHRIQQSQFPFVDDHASNFIPLEANRRSASGKLIIDN